MPFDAQVLGQHRGIDADQLAIGVDQRASGIADVDGRVGLDEVFESRHAQLAAAGGAHDALRDGLRQAHGVADGEHDVADAQPVRMPQRHHRYVRFQIELQHREVGVRIAADDLRVGDAAVGELGADQIGGGDHVVIGDHVRGAIDDDARAQALLEALPVARPGVTKQLFDGVRLNAFGHEPGRIDVDHGRRRPLDRFGIRIRGARGFRLPVPVLRARVTARAQRVRAAAPAGAPASASR